MSQEPRRIIFHPSDRVHSAMFSGESQLSAEDNELMAPWYFLRKRLEENGFQVQTSYESNFDLKNAHRIIFFDIPDELRKPSHRLIYAAKRLYDKFKRIKPRPYFYKKVKSAGLTDKTALMIWEPAAVIPENEQESLHGLFPRVFTWNEKYWDKNSIYKPIHWPQPLKTPNSPTAKSFKERKLLVNFSGNKSSKHKGELYSARKEVIEYMGKHHINQFDHYGPGWEGYPLWKGIATSKFNIYPNYKFGLCYENLLNEPGYVTEKIFDCLRANSVPVYWGASNIEDLIPTEAFIDRRKFQSTKELIDHLNQITEEDWLSMLEAGKKYIESESFKRYLPENFTKLIFEGLGL